MKMLSLVVSAIIVTAAPAMARDNIQVAGSSTVLPYASIVAEAFGENFEYPTPVVESGGSSSGLKRFCDGIGSSQIDIANASRPIRQSEIEVCKSNGVTDIVEVRIGYDGIVFSSDINGFSFEFTPADIYTALNSTSNAATWNDVKPEWPSQEITMYIPGTKHGTREVFEEQVLLQGCKDTGDFDKLIANGVNEDDAESTCMKVRTDGKSVDIDGDYTETLARIQNNPDGIGVFGLAFYENNTDRLQVATMNGVVPSQSSIAIGEYPVSRPLFFYIKSQHVGIIPGLQEFAQFFVSDEIAGTDGPLAQYGLVSDPALIETQTIVDNLIPLQ